MQGAAVTQASMRGMPVEKVAVLLVHGIGEQKRFEHLEGETRKIVAAILADYGARRRDVTITLSTAAGDAYRGEQSSWVSGADAPLHALVELPAKIVDIAFHEVWWADVNEALTLGKQVRFWLWGLSLAGTSTNNVQVLPGALAATRLPDHAGELTWLHRAERPHAPARLLAVPPGRHCGSPPHRAHLAVAALCGLSADQARLGLGGSCPTFLKPSGFGR